ncbi:hypothetical protein HDU79_011331, partial [Rhizoclosmatium sp. JEL0117]
AAGAPLPFQNAPSTAVVGDILAFDLGGNHAVVDVTADQYASCNVDTTTQPVLGLTSNGLATPGFSYTLTQPGTYYIVCPVGQGQHCQDSMKFTLTVTAAAAAGGAQQKTGTTAAVQQKTQAAQATSAAAPFVISSTLVMPDTCKSQLNSVLTMYTSCGVSSSSTPTASKCVCQSANMAIVQGLTTACGSSGQNIAGDISALQAACRSVNGGALGSGLGMGAVLAGFVSALVL